MQTGRLDTICYRALYEPTQIAAARAAAVHKSSGCPALRGALRITQGAGNSLNHLRWTRLWLWFWLRFVAELERVSPACGLGHRGCAPRSCSESVGTFLGLATVYRPASPCMSAPPRRIFPRWVGQKSGAKG